jgi:predicted dinucleotide-binding enzyme
MTIGIIGSGAIGAAFATTLARAGIEATFQTAAARSRSKPWFANSAPR